MGLTASAGVSINKFVAKIASDLQKPDGLTFIGPSKVESFMEKLPVEKFYGVGKVTAARMKALALHTGADLKGLSEGELVKHFGKAGHFYYGIVRGIDNRAVEPNRETKSVGAEDTYAEDLTDVADMEEQLEPLAAIVAERLQTKGLKGKTVTLKVKYNDFATITRSRSVTEPINDVENILSVAKQLLHGTNLVSVRIRLLGVTSSNFGTDALPAARDSFKRQLKLF